MGWTSDHSPSQIFPRKIFLFLVPFSSIEEKHFCEQLLLFIVFSVFVHLPYLLKKIILFSSLFVFVHHASHSPLFFISVFAESLGFLDLLLLVELICILLHFLQFSLNNNNFSFLLLFFQKKTFQISILHAWVAS